MSEDTSILGLATIRRARGISLEQIAESTKISVRSLRAIEQGDFAKLPGGIYNTNYIRQYARAIDYDEARLLACYQDATHAAPKTGGKDALMPDKKKALFDWLSPASSID